MIDFEINIIEDFISLEDADTIVGYIKDNCLNNKKFYTPMKSKIENKIRHESHIPELHTFSDHLEILGLLKKYSDKFLLECNLFFKDEEELYLTAQWLTMLGPGSRLPPHKDNHQGAEHLLRSGVIYLNQDFDGGDLNFLDEDFTIKPKKLSLVLFNSNQVHRITEIFSGLRIAMPIWATNIKEKEICYEF